MPGTSRREVLRFGLSAFGTLSLPGLYRLRTGRVIGATDRLGETVADRRVGPQDFLATIYHHLGIDYANAALPDQTGRPVPIVPNGTAIPELVGA